MDVEERVGAKMFGDADAAFPGALCRGDVDVFGADADGVWRRAFAASGPSIRFILGEPMKPATNLLRGRS